MCPNKLGCAFSPSMRTAILDVLSFISHRCLLLLFKNCIKSALYLSNFCRVNLIVCLFLFIFISFLTTQGGSVKIVGRISYEYIQLLLLYLYFGNPLCH